MWVTVLGTLVRGTPDGEGMTVTDGSATLTGTNQVSGGSSFTTDSDCEGTTSFTAVQP